MHRPAKAMPGVSDHGKVRRDIIVVIADDRRGAAFDRAARSPR
jgi:hypothetical protein